MRPSFFYEELLPLPRGAFSVVMYYSDQKNYVIEVLRKRGVEFGTGKYFPRATTGINVDDDTVNELIAVGFTMRKDVYKVMRVVDFLKTIERNQKLDKLAETVRFGARLDPKTKEI